MINIYDLYNWTAGSFPDRPSVIYNDRVYSFRDMAGRINSLASGLYALGLRPGQTLGMLLYNSADFFTVFYAAHKIGCALLPLNWRLNMDDQREHICLAGCDMLIYESALAEGIAGIKPQLDTVSRYVSRGEGEENTLEGLMASGDPDWSFKPELRGDDPALYLLTGGTSSNSKLAVATQEKMVLRVTMPYLYQTLDYNYQDNFLLFNPMFHFGAEGIYLPLSIAGGCITLMDKMDVEGILRAVEKYRITRILLLPPTLCNRIAASKELQGYDRNSVKHVTLSGGGSSEKLAAQVFATFPNAKIRTCYGSTEFAAETTHFYTAEEFAADPGIARSVGKRAPFCYIKLLDENGQEVAAGTPGECYARSYCMLEGYKGRPEPFKDGWFPTGDFLEMSGDGHYYFRDRKNFMIKSGGENIIPNEVEEAINLSPKVEKSAVFALPDNDLGEIVAAAVVLRSGETMSEGELADFVKTKIAGYKKPRRVFFVDELCYTTVGKVDKRALINKALESKLL